MISVLERWEYLIVTVWVLSETWVISDAVKDEALFRRSGTYLQSQHLRERARQDDHEFKTSLGYVVIQPNRPKQQQQ